MKHTSENDIPELAARALINRLFDGVEPPHRAGMAESSITHGAEVSRRRVYTVAGTAVCVLAIAAGAVVVANRGADNRDDWSLVTGTVPPTSASAFEDQAPTYSDKIREIQAELPGLLTPLLPAGLTVRYDTTRQGPISSRTGDVSPDFMVRVGAKDYVLQIDADNTGYEDAFTRNPATVPVQVVGEPSGYGHCHRRDRTTAGRPSRRGSNTCPRTRRSRRSGS
ncbi:hypothetical protein ACFQ9X_20935 [Catenulispora yoronensis]